MTQGKSPSFDPNARTQDFENSATGLGDENALNQPQPDLAATWPLSPRSNWPQKACKKEQVCIEGPRTAGVIWGLKVMMLCGWVHGHIPKGAASKKIFRASLEKLKDASRP